MSTTAWLETTPNPADESLSGLNARQRAAVTHGEGPLLVLAGAGTGKTAVITRRIAWLVATRRARPSEILALTFTEKAAAEMQERVDVLVPYGFADVGISTFHSFGHRLLGEHALTLGLPGEPKVLSQAQVLVLLREHLFELPLERLRPLPDPTRHLAALLGLVDRARDEGVAPAEYAAHAERSRLAAADDADREAVATHAETAAFYAAYLDLLTRHGLCDYGQLQWLALRLLEDHPAVVREVTRRYRYILVDEFQDTNVAQFRLVAALARGHRNLTVVGDDDQSIYGFRGAASSNLRQFVDTYPDAARVVLIDNYRSTQPLLDASYRLIRHNDPDRLETKIGVDKRLVARGATHLGPPAEFHWFDTSSSEAEFVARRIKEAVESGERRLGDHAVLARTHKSARAVLAALAYRGVPFRYAGNRGLYDAEEVRACVHLLGAVADPDASSALYHLAASEAYGVPAFDLARLSGQAQRTRRSLREIAERELGNADPESEGGLSETARERLGSCLADLAVLREAAVSRPTGEILYRFLQRSRWLERLSQSTAPADEQKVKNIARFFELVRGFADLAPEDRVTHFVRHIELLREAGDDPAQAEPDETDDAVQVMTVHRAKGLEFPVVFLVDLEEGRFPAHKKRAPLPYPEALVRESPPAGDAHEQEERRLFYVAMTRARERLVLTGARDLGGKRLHKPSRFVAEALGLAAPPAGKSKASALEALARHAPEVESPAAELAPMSEDEPLALSQEHVADWLTCPLKYKFKHVLRVPLLPHHGVMYGQAMHHALQVHYRQALQGWPASEDDLLAAFAEAWRPEGFLTREHEEARYAAGQETLRRFFAREESTPSRPAAIEREFRFQRGTVRVQGRFDRIDLRPEGPVIVDFKTSDVRDGEAAERRARENLQLRIYALAYRESYGTRPAAVELQFVETGLVGRLPVTDEVLGEAEAAIDEAAAGIRRRQYTAAPTYTACQMCAFRAVCPSRYEG
ncbi:MAG TPA: ATP-dependent DNA helicase [Candidatus Eisenbacteria bacterium]|jgi:DNA helicase-2/ATP-dependent DNA helicase PcrA|nr:ATP-dependent DNA helicase [Candidatus Eisenbacteria bacterium]